MRFDFTPEQYALRDAARELFEKENPPSRLRALWNGAERDDRLWRAMAEMGILGILIPEAHGGIGGDEVDLALVLEEAGRACVPEPLVETVAVAAPALVHVPGGSEWLPRIASGDVVATLALAGQPYVIEADVAGLVLVEEVSGLALRHRDSYTPRPVTSEDKTRRLFRVGLNARAGADAENERAAWATACLLNGVSMHLLEVTVAYVKERHQFGRPVGSFQAVKHMLADTHVAIEGARAAAWYAAYAIARDLPDLGAAASVAKAAAGEAGALANRVALQCHGGIGFTWEHDLHFWLKRGKALEQAYGSAREHRALLAATVFGDA